MNRSTREWIAASVVACVLAGATAVSAQDGSAAKTAGLRIGVFDSRAVAMAYARAAEEPGMGPTMKLLREEHKKAKAAGDAEKIKQLEGIGRRMQDQLHQQGFSTGSVVNIVEKIKDQLPAIAKQAGVDLIISRWDAFYLAGGIETVDVTDAMVKPFRPDANTLKLIEQVKKTKPLPLAEVVKMPTEK